MFLTDMARNIIWSKTGKFLKTTFNGGWHWDKENGFQSISNYVADNPGAVNIASFNGFGGYSSKNGFLGNLFNKFTGGGLTDAETQMNDFNASQAEADRAFQSYEAALQRDWSAQEAERARDWQEEMYTKYNSLSGKIAQAEQAGVNPMLAVTGNAVSPISATSPVPSGASPSGSRASGGGFAHQSFTDLIGMVLGFKQLQSEMEVNEALAEKYRQEATGQSITNETLKEWNVSQILEARSRIEYNTENTVLVTSKILNTDADTEKKSAELAQIASSIKNMAADTDVKVKQLAVMASEIIKNERSLDVMSAQIASIASEIGLNKERGKEIAQNVRNLVQEYGHDKVMNALEENIAEINSASASYTDTRDLPALQRSIVEFMKFIRSGVVK